MRNNQIALILNLSKSTVSHILHGNTKYSKKTREEVFKYRDYEFQVEQYFQESVFASICECVIKKATKRDSERYDDVIKFAVRCLSAHELLNEDSSELQIIYESLKLFTDELFIEMTNIAVKKSNNLQVRIKAAMLNDLSYKIGRAFR